MRPGLPHAAVALALLIAAGCSSSRTVRDAAPPDAASGDLGSAVADEGPARLGDGPPATPEGGGVDGQGGSAGSAGDAAPRPDAPIFGDAVAEPGPDAYAQPPGACTTLVSAQPFACTLRGMGNFVFRESGAPAPTRAVELQLYFPRGRAAGAPVSVAANFRLDGSDAGAYASPPTTLAANGTTTENMHLEIPLGEWYIDAALLPGAEGLRLQIQQGRLGSAVQDGVAFLKPAGEAPPATLLALSESDWVSPLQGIELRGTVPLDPATISRARVRAASQPTPSATGTVPPDFGLGEVAFAVLRPAGGALPAGRALTIDAAGLADLVGRPVQVKQPRSLVPSAVVTDLSFAAAPPAGAVAASFAAADWAISDGALAIPPPAAPGATRYESYTAVVSLGPAPAGAQRVLVRLQVNCSSALAGLVAGAVVDESGAASLFDANLGCSPSSFREHAVPVPGSGRLYLVIDHVRFRRNMGGVPSVSDRRFRLDLIAFE